MVTYEALEKEHRQLVLEFGNVKKPGADWKLSFDARIKSLIQKLSRLQSENGDAIAKGSNVAQVQKLIKENNKILKLMSKCVDLRLF